MINEVAKNDMKSLSNETFQVLGSKLSHVQMECGMHMDTNKKTVV